ncbi:hypothetical protein [Pseudorhodoferax sp. Leaf274]|uniref:hypothetical protein n=1 Tax=Pseudorhodoferax sp. Leaf274 TaxID=1736318 RepID=UPI000702BF6A|nr:hypothetical protein [Pseudorhodoferax sp. Leaf274]KQP41147.1 hypothetical protein ASF44_30360 [Pseudorhodoferax sp. Leaf274]
MTQQAELPRIRSIAHRLLEPPFLEGAASIEARIDALGDHIGSLLAWTLQDCKAQACQHLICTSYLSMYLTGDARLCSRLFDRIETRGLPRPLGLIQPYQCTGWGYALRFIGRGGARRLAITIADVDLHDLQGCRSHPLIGISGFGVSCILVELEEGAELPSCDGPYANSGFSEFLHAIRSQRRTYGCAPTFLPFLTPELRIVAERLLGKEDLGPDRHAVYGHCFGSDPWIGLLEWLQCGNKGKAHVVSLGAVAYDGYFTLGRMRVAPDVRLWLDIAASQEARPMHASAWDTSVGAGRRPA